MKVSRSGFYLLLAALLILASIPLATRNAVGMDNPMVFGRVAIGALLMFCGVFMVATVVRSRLIIEGSQIRFRIVFREEVFPLSEIEGFRTISTGACLASCFASRNLREGPKRAYRNSPV